MIEQLERIGFLNLHSRRLGPCFTCDKNLLTYYVPERKEWFCELCYYSNEENRELINHFHILNFEETLANQPSMQELMAELQRVRDELAGVKAKSTDNIFVGGTDNLTIKHRQANPRGWGVPTKNQQGQGYFRSGDFPMGFFLDKAKHLLILHQEIPISPREEQIFEDRYIKQQLVVAKRRQQTEQAPSTPQFSTSTPTSTTTTTTTSTTSSGRTFSSLGEAEKASIMKEANDLKDVLYKGSLPEALKAVLAGRNITA